MYLFKLGQTKHDGHWQYYDSLYQTPKVKVYMAAKLTASTATIDSSVRFVIYITRAVTCRCQLDTEIIMGLIISVIGKHREVCVLGGGVYFNILQLHRLGLYFGGSTF